MTSDPISLRQATRQRLEQLQGEVFFSDLRAHLERDAIFIVAPHVDLIDCAVAVAMDDVSLVEPWIADGSLRKPSRRERDEWPKQDKRAWRAVVVQPFVLVQDPTPELD